MKASYRRPSKGEMKVLFDLLIPNQEYTHQQLNQMALERGINYSSISNLLRLNIFLEKTGHNLYRRPCDDEITEINRRFDHNLPENQQLRTPRHGEVARLYALLKAGESYTRREVEELILQNQISTGTLSYLLNPASGFLIFDTVKKTFYKPTAKEVQNNRLKADDSESEQTSIVEEPEESQEYKPIVEAEESIILTRKNINELVTNTQALPMIAEALVEIADLLSKLQANLNPATEQTKNGVHN